MTAGEAAQGLLLLAAAGIILSSCLGLLIGDTFDCLHYLGPATVLAPVLIAIAVAIKFSSPETVVKGILLTMAFVLSSPVLTHATAEAGFRHRPKNRAEGNE